mmetsp:Transcript_31278/g.82893  ORF Transcript_31278/g.82893 Transcript_31278/m.82893 type:complete len:239 (+) Transcript_31278:61-777(+)
MPITMDTADLFASVWNLNFANTADNTWCKCGAESVGCELRAACDQCTEAFCAASGCANLAPECQADLVGQAVGSVASIIIGVLFGVVAVIAIMFYISVAVVVISQIIGCFCHLTPGQRMVPMAPCGAVMLLVALAMGLSVLLGNPTCGSSATPGIAPGQGFSVGFSSAENPCNGNEGWMLWAVWLWTWRLTLLLLFPGNICAMSAVCYFGFFQERDEDEASARQFNEKSGLMEDGAEE